MAPYIWQRWKHGPNPQIAVRHPADAEFYGLKLINIAMPQHNHRIKHFRNKRAGYIRTTPTTVVEGYDEYLGFVSLMGLAILFVSFLVRGRRLTVFDKLAFLAILAFLLATLGGVGAIFARAVLSEIRCYNRISPILALFGLWAVMFSLKKLFLGRSKAATVFLSGIILVVGVFDQLTPVTNPNQRKLLAAEIKSDKDFINRIERNTAPSAMILQLPYVQFPEAPTVVKMTDYSHLKGPLFSKTLRWSYGAPKGRHGADQIRQASAIPVDLGHVKKMGYTGIYIDRYGFEDSAAALEKDLTKRLKVEPIVSHNKRLSYFPLDSYQVSEEAEEVKVPQ